MSGPWRSKTTGTETETIPRETPEFILEPLEEAPTTPAADVGRYPEHLVEPDGKTWVTARIQRVHQGKRRRKETEAKVACKGRPTGKCRGRGAFADGWNTSILGYNKLVIMTVIRHLRRPRSCCLNPSPPPDPVSGR